MDSGEHLRRITEAAARATRRAAEAGRRLGETEPRLADLAHWSRFVKAVY